MANKTPKTPNTPNTPNDASLQSTKQMLDELDALMEKMLTLPVNDLGDAAAFPPPVVKEPTLSATLTLLSPPSVPAPAPTPPLSKKPASRPSYQIPALAAPRPRVEEPAAPPSPLPFNPPHFEMPPVEASEPESLRFDTPEPEPEPLTNEVMPVSVLPRLEPLMNEIAEPPSSSFGTQWLYLPLVWVNQGFDGATLAFGGAGRWMRSEGGRMLLGFSGVALMAAAVAWFLKDWLGWNW
jgi:hypothetical protein